MGESPDVATDRGLSIQWWYVVAAGAAAWALFVGSVEVERSAAPQLADAVTLLALLAWPLVPVATYLDLRAIREAAAWEPATKSWLLASLVPILNLPTAVAYCLRRHGAVEGRLPSANWRYGVYAGFLGWVGVVAADVALDHVSIGVLESIVFGPLLLLVWLGFPVALYLDAVRVRAYTEMSPNVRVLVALSAVPLVNLLVGGAYLVGRWWHRRKADPDAEPTLPGEHGVGSRRPEPVSPWFRRSAGVFAAYVLVALAIGWGLALESDLAWDVLALAAWPPFGLAFVACVHFDLRDVREAGVPWGWTRYLYYSSVVFSGPAFWYLVRRLTKVNRARSEGWLEEDDGGDGSGGEPDAGRWTSAEEPDSGRGLDRTDVGDGAGFEWEGGSRG